MKNFLTVVTFCLVCLTVAAQNSTPAIWEQIRTGMPIAEATELLKGSHAQASLTRADGTGYRKFWPLDGSGLVAAKEIERAYFPHGHVLTIEFDRNGKITDMSQTFISEQTWKESLNAIQRQQ